MTKEIINTKTFVNPEFTPTDSHSVVETQQIRINLSGTININMFAMKQIIFGFALTNNCTIAQSNVMAKLAIYMADRYDTDNDYKGSGKEFNRSEVKLMLEAIEFRLAHCEVHKKNNDPVFNADTYVAMRILSCDLRDWLAVHLA